MKTSNLEVNKIYSSYKELCKVLEEPIKSGCSKKAQLKEWEHYFKWERIGNKYKIIKIEDIDGLVIIPPKTRQKGSKYADLVYPMLIEMLYKESKGRNEFPDIIEKRNNYYSKLGFASYLFGSVSSNRESDKFFFDELQEICSRIAYEQFSRTLDNLVKNHKINVLTLYYIYKTNDEKDFKTYYICSVKQAGYIQWHIDIVTSELGCKNLYEVCKKNLYSKLKAMVNERLYKFGYQFNSSVIRIALPNNSGLNIFDTHSNMFKRMSEQDIEQHISTLKNQLNNLIMNLVNTQIEKIIATYNELIPQEKVVESIINNEELIKKANQEVQMIKQIRDDYGSNLSIEQCIEIIRDNLNRYANIIIRGA